jgi:gliding motility-associated-like protein
MSDNFTQIGSVGSTETSYSDDVSGLTGSEGIFTYYVEAVESNGNLATSKSNQVVIEMETKILAPNAFIPEGLPPDNEFKPVTSFIDRDTYELLVFNKWGQMIFSTKDSEKGWDGKFNGEYVPSDAYVYRIKVKSPDGRDFQKQGTVTVIR